MSAKSYSLGVIVGRFQILHKGHAQIIRRAFELCDSVGIMVGSSQESRSYKNPFTFEERKEMLLAAFPELKVVALPDIGVGNCRAWGDYVLEQAIQSFGKAPDVFVSGREERRISWFDENAAELFVPKSIDISASKMKEFIIKGDRESWDEYIEPSLRSRYDDMRKIILLTVDNTDTDSM